MTLNPNPALLDSLYWITLIAVIVSSFPCRPANSRNAFCLNGPLNPEKSL